MARLARLGAAGQRVQVYNCSTAVEAGDGGWVLQVSVCCSCAVCRRWYITGWSGVGPPVSPDTQHAPWAPGDTAH